MACRSSTDRPGVAKYQASVFAEGQRTLDLARNAKQLMPQVELFGDIVRWRDLRKMYAFGKAGSRWPVQEGLDNIRVTGYEAGALNEIRPWRWGQSVLISYVLVDRQVVRQTLDQQVWVSEDQGKTWFRENPPPRF